MRGPRQPTIVVGVQQEMPHFEPGVPMKARNWRRRILGIVALSLAAAAVSTTSAGPASAIDADTPVIVNESTGWGTGQNKDQEAYCPDGTNVIGTGATGGGTNSVIDDLIPSADHVHGMLWLDESFTDATTNLTVRAVCADVDGYEIVRVPSLNDLNSPKSAVAHCSSATKDLLGTGFEITGGYGEVGVTKVIPYAASSLSTDSVTVTAYADDTGTSNRWTIIAYAICGNVVGETTIVSHDIPYLPIASVESQGGIETCPTDRFNSGAGATASAGGGNIHLGPFMPAAYYDSTSFMMAEAHEDHDGTITPWHLSMYAICVVL